MIKVLSIWLPTQQQWGLRPLLMAGGVVCCCFLVVLALSFRFKRGGVDISPTAVHCRGVVDWLVNGHWAVVGQWLVGRWSIIKLIKIRIFIVVPVDLWQWRFENAAVGVRPQLGESSWKQPLCLGTTSLISDLDKPAAMVDAID